jgi:hypothetical protein
MKRDLELIRKMVLAIEDAPSGFALDEFKFEGYTDAQVGYHGYLLIDAGIAKGKAESPMWGSDVFVGFISSLTWEGHEFADAARDETRWRKAMGVVQEKGGTVTIGVLTQLLVALMKGAFGIP